MARKDLIAKLEERLKCRLICYVTGDRKGQEAQIGEDALPPIYEHLAAIGKTERVAFFTYSRGGHTLSGRSSIVSHVFREERVAVCEVTSGFSPCVDVAKCSSTSGAPNGAVG